MTKNALIVLAAVATMACSPLGSAGIGGPNDVLRADSYSGTPLSGNTFLCRSDKVVAGGYRGNLLDGTTSEIAEVAKQKQMTTWRVSLEETEALVTAYTGATQTVEAAVLFASTRTPEIVSLFRREGTGSETITISLKDSSFVYSGHSAGPLLNKVNVFVGRCIPHL